MGGPSLVAFNGFSCYKIWKNTIYIVNSFYPESALLKNWAPRGSGAFFKPLISKVRCQTTLGTLSWQLQWGRGIPRFMLWILTITKWGWQLFPCGISQVLKHRCTDSSWYRSCWCQARWMGTTTCIERWFIWKLPGKMLEIGEGVLSLGFRICATGWQLAVEAVTSMRPYSVC